MLPRDSGARPTDSCSAAVAASSATPMKPRAFPSGGHGSPSSATLGRTLCVRKGFARRVGDFVQRDVVIDEMHTYHGIFGPHVANVYAPAERVPDGSPQRPCRPPRLRHVELALTMQRARREEHVDARGVLTSPRDCGFCARETQESRAYCLERARRHGKEGDSEERRIESPRRLPVGGD